jgi:outer membrane murein-binding lipoprotein Lpp
MSKSNTSLQNEHPDTQLNQAAASLTFTATKLGTDAATKALFVRVDARRVEGVRPRDIEPTQLTSPLDAVIARIQANLAAFAEYDVTPDVVAAVQAIALDYLTKISALPTDLRTARRAPVADKQLTGEAGDLLGRYLGYLDRKARGPVLRDAARKLGVGLTRGKSVQSLEKAYRDVLHGAQDLGLLALLSVKTAQVKQLHDMHAKLSARLPGKSTDASTLNAQLVAVDRLQMTLELFYADVGAAAEWALPADARLAVVSLLPRVETGRKNAKPVVTPAPGAAALIAVGEKADEGETV